MNYIFKEDKLEIKLSWKERFLFFIKGKIVFDKRSAHDNAKALMRLVSESLIKYGDSTKFKD
jgi:hypothetical protein